MFIDPSTYMTNPEMRAVADRVIDAAGLHKNDVRRIEGGPSTFTVTLLVRDEAGTIKVHGGDIVERTVSVSL